MTNVVSEERQDMRKDFAQIADEVTSSIGLLRQGSPDAMKG